MAPVEKLGCGPLRQPLWQHNWLPMEPLDCMLESRAISFFEDVVTDLDDVVRAHRQEESVEGRMV